MTDPSQVDRRKQGSEQHVVVDSKMTPLAATVTAGNDSVVKELEAVVDAIPQVRGKPGCPSRRPLELYTDGAYDSDPRR